MYVYVYVIVFLQKVPWLGHGLGKVKEEKKGEAGYYGVTIV